MLLKYGPALWEDGLTDLGWKTDCQIEICIHIFKIKNCTCWFCFLKTAKVEGVHNSVLQARDFLVCSHLLTKFLS